MLSENPVSVAAIILNWNNYSDTAHCLKSLSQVEYAKMKRIVVDNGSSDKSKEKIADDFPEVDILSSETNRGFGGGMNLGIKEAIKQRYDYIWLLNNDVEFPKKSVLKVLVKLLQEKPGIGMATPEIYESMNSKKKWFTQGEIDWKTATANHINSSPNSSAEVVKNQYIPLCSALVDTDVFCDVGLLPEQYFLYYEDLDFGVTLRDHSYDIVTCTSTKVVHDQGGTAGGHFDQLFSYYQPRNLILFARKFRERLHTNFSRSVAQWTAEQIAYRIINDHSVSPFVQGVYDGIRGQSGKGRYPRE